jgi:hypothetical protein
LKHANLIPNPAKVTCNQVHILVSSRILIIFNSF